MMRAAAMQTNTEPPGCCSTRPATPTATRISAAKSENCSADTVIAVCNLEARYDRLCASCAFSQLGRSTTMRSLMGIKLIGLDVCLPRSVTRNANGA